MLNENVVDSTSVEAFFLTIIAIFVSTNLSERYEIFEDIVSLRKWRRQLILEKKLLGFVPTMGCLHEGHLSLVFIPKVEEIYPSGAPLEVDKQKGTFVELEGKTRPTFFRGVSTVVTKFDLASLNEISFSISDSDSDWFSIGYLIFSLTQYLESVSILDKSKISVEAFFLTIIAIFVSTNLSERYEIFEDIVSLRKWRRQLILEKKLLGFVPTMGCLHEGHLSLVFIPKVEEIYPSGAPLEVDKQKGTFVELEGKTRPTFFRGVSTVVTKLFNIVQPDHVYLGQKDAQQCVVIRSMIKDLHFPIEMHVGETVRENDGLAMSSRNKYLSKEMRKVATTLYDALMIAKKSFYDKGIRDREKLLQGAHELIERARKKVDEDQTLEFEVKLDYLSLADPETLEEIDFIIGEDEGGNGALLSGALYVGTTRLIDNLLLN
ncbi:14229_t:CDS:10, partial [Entrophospora sp. SA101]